MSCFPEFTYAVYADGELPPEEVRQVEAHLAACARCRTLVEGLRRENRQLAELLQEAEPTRAPDPLPAAPPHARPLDILWTALAVLAAAFGLNTLANWTMAFEAPAGTDWLNPFSLSAQLNLFFSSFFYFLEEGAAMLISSLATVGFLTLGLLVVVGGVFLLRRRPRAVAVLATLVLALGLAVPGAAHERRKAETITIASGETLDDSLLAMGKTLVVDGVVTGNVIFFGERASINGTVKGDLVSFSQSVDLDGTVEGNVYSFTQWFNLRGQVRRSLHTFVQNLKIGADAKVEHDLLAFVQQLGFDGTVTRDALLFCGALDVNGNVGRHLTVYGDRINLLPGARVGGDLTVHLEKEKNLNIDPEAVVAGKTKTRMAEREAPTSRFARPRFYMQNALGLIIVFLIGLLLNWRFPALFMARLESAGAALQAAGVGFLALLAPPVAAIVLGVVLVGIGILADAVLIALLFPVLMVVVWGIGVYLAKLFVAYLIGRALLPRPADDPGGFAVSLLVGLLIVYVAFHVPYVGLVLHILVWLLGLGLAVVQIYRHRRPPLPAA